MATKFAKLFQTQHGQLLATLDTDENGDPCVRLRGEERHGMEAVSVLSWGHKSQASLEASQAAFDSIGQEKAEETAAEIASALESIGGCNNGN